MLSANIFSIVVCGVEGQPYALARSKTKQATTQRINNPCKLFTKIETLTVSGQKLLSLDFTIINTGKTDIFYLCEKRPSLYGFDFKVKNLQGKAIPLILEHPLHLHQGPEILELTHGVKLRKGELDRFRVFIDYLFDTHVPNTYFITVSTTIRIGTVDKTAALTSYPAKITIS